MPARKTRALKLLQGTLREGREPKEPAKPRKGRARPPAWLSQGERRAFKALALETERCGTPAGSFAHVLTGAAVIWEQLRRDTQAIAEGGSTYETTTTTGAKKLVPRPEVLNRAATLKLLRGYLSELGLTPVAIGRIDLSALQDTEGEGDPGERHFSFGKGKS